MSDLYEIRSISRQDKADVLIFLQKYFYNEEPLNKYLYKEKGKETDCKDRGHGAINVIDEGLSLMAVSTATSGIVGVSINEIHKVNSAHDDHPNPAKIFKLIDKLRKECGDAKKFEDGKEMSVKQLVVSFEWGNKGIALELLKRTKDLAVEKGFGQIQAYCTNKFSIKVFQKLGFQCIHSIKYEDYREDGKIVFKPDLPHTHIEYMILKI